MSAQQEVAVVLTWHDKVGLFKRGRDVESNPGKWHCITGSLPDSRSPFERACQELYEQTGLGVADLVDIVEGDGLTVADDAGQERHLRTFHASTTRRRLVLNGDHDSYRWVLPSRLGRFDGRVDWLDRVVGSLGLSSRRTSRPDPLQPEPTGNVQ